MVTRLAQVQISTIVFCSRTRHTVTMAVAPLWQPHPTIAGIPGMACIRPDTLRQIHENLRQHPDRREQIRKFRDDWTTELRDWAVRRTCELGSAEHLRQVAPINEKVADKLDALLGFRIRRKDLVLFFDEALHEPRSPSRSRPRSRSRWRHPGKHGYELEALP